MVTPKRIGRFLEIDSSGFIVPDVSHQHLTGEWLAPVQEVVARLKTEAEATAVFIRGSVPRGLGIKNVSDLDFLYLSEVQKPDLESSIEKELQEKFPYIKGLELVQLDRKRLDLMLAPQTRPYFQMLLKTQGLCLDGLDITKSIDPFKLDLNMCSHVFAIDKEFEKLSQWLEEDRIKNKEIETRKWFYRRLVRSGAEICIGRVNRFTRDLYLCYEEFVNFYPQYSTHMERALDGALNGATDPMLENELIALISAERNLLSI
jgi:hypothetical protein